MSYSLLCPTWPNASDALPFVSHSSGVIPQDTVPLWAVTPSTLLTHTSAIQAIFQAHNFTAQEGELVIIPGSGVYVGLGDVPSFWTFGGLPTRLNPHSIYRVDVDSLPTAITISHVAYAWGLGAYDYKKLDKVYPKLAVPEDALTLIRPLVLATHWIRSLVNRPPNQLTPLELSQEALGLEQFGATGEVLVGEDLEACSYPAIYAVGKGSLYPPRVVDLQWGSADHPLLTLVGKGVTFDSGGLNLKSSKYMALMKDDMGGAAHAMGLAYILMALQAPLRIRVLIGAVENSVSATSYRPSDIVDTRKGTTIEIGDTDAEGRVVLCDLLHEGSQDDPALMIDFATLTGAARVALGPDLVALFSNDDALGRNLQDLSLTTQDPFWQFPLWKGYKDDLKSLVADFSTVSPSPYADHMMAALFLNEFVTPTTPWVHLDLSDWNKSSKPGRPEGGEAVGLRTLLRFLDHRFDLKLGKLV